MTVSGGREHLLIAPELVADGISVPWSALFADGVECLLQGRVVAIIVAVGLDGAEAFYPKVFPALE